MAVIIYSMEELASPLRRMGNRRRAWPEPCTENRAITLCIAPSCRTTPVHRDYTSWGAEGSLCTRYCITRTWKAKTNIAAPNDRHGCCETDARIRQPVRQETSGDRGNNRGKPSRVIQSLL